MSEPKYLDAEEFIRKIGHDLELSSCMPEDWCRGVRFVLYRIKNELAADVVEVVRCKDCIYHTGYGECGNGRWDNWSNSDYKSSYPEALDMDYCSYGVRRDG